MGWLYLHHHPERLYLQQKRAHSEFRRQPALHCQHLPGEGERGEAALEAITLTDATGGYTYFKLRDLGSARGFNVGYANGVGIFIQTDAPYTDAD